MHLMKSMSGRRLVTGATGFQAVGRQLMKTEVATPAIMPHNNDAPRLRKGCMTWASLISPSSPLTCICSQRPLWYPMSSSRHTPFNDPVSQYAWPSISQYFLDPAALLM